MSTYRELDEAIVGAIARSPGVRMAGILGCADVLAAAKKQAGRNGDPMRGVDARLQALRKKGKIHHAKPGCDCTAKPGWFMTRVGK